MLRWRARHGHAHSEGVGLKRTFVIRRSSFGPTAERRTTIAAVAFLAAAPLTGCGGDDTATTFPAGVSRPIAKVQFLREADRICQSTNTRVQAAADDLLTGPAKPPPAQVRRIVLGVVVPTLRSEVRAIRALGAPAGDQRQVDGILAATERGIEQVAADPAGALDGPPPAFRQAGRLARAYGSNECGVPSQ